MGDPAALVFEAVTKVFPGIDGGPETPVLAELDLTIEPGAAVAVVGPSGCGKSTLLHLAGGLDEPTRGRVVLGGQDLSDLDGDARASLRGERVGFVFQEHHLLPQLSSLENVLLPSLVAPASERAVAEQRAGTLLERVGLGARLDHRPAQLSGGERQRVALVRALVRGPSLLLADEPTGALDQSSARSLGELLAELNAEEGVTLVVVTHSAELAASLPLTYELSEGRVEARAGSGA